MLFTNTTTWMLINNVYIIVIYVIITVNYWKCMLSLYSPLNSYLYVHCILDFKLILLLYYFFICMFKDYVELLTKSNLITMATR